MTRPRCDRHGLHCPPGSRHDGDEYGWNEEHLTGRDLKQAELDDADRMTGWDRA